MDALIQMAVGTLALIHGKEVKASMDDIREMLDVSWSDEDIRVRLERVCSARAELTKIAWPCSCSKQCGGVVQRLRVAEGLHFCRTNPGRFQIVLTDQFVEQAAYGVYIPVATARQLVDSPGVLMFRITIARHIRRGRVDRIPIFGDHGIAAHFGENENPSEVRRRVRRYLARLAEVEPDLRYEVPRGGDEVVRVRPDGASAGESDDAGAQDAADVAVGRDHAAVVGPDDDVADERDSAADDVNTGAGADRGRWPGFRLRLRGLASRLRTRSLERETARRVVANAQHVAAVIAQVVDEARARGHEMARHVGDGVRARGREMARHVGARMQRWATPSCERPNCGCATGAQPVQVQSAGEPSSAPSATAPSSAAPRTAAPSSSTPGPAAPSSSTPGQVTLNTAVFSPARSAHSAPNGLPPELAAMGHADLFNSLMTAFDHVDWASGALAKPAPAPRPATGKQAEIKIYKGLRFRDGVMIDPLGVQPRRRQRRRARPSGLDPPGPGNIPDTG
jgi:hypothetical protein